MSTFSPNHSPIRCGRAMARSLFCLIAFVACAGSARAADEKDVKVADPEPVALETKDGVELKCTWYAGGVTMTAEGPKATDGKKVVPLIMLHGWGGQREDYSAIATYLQQLGHAVIVPDLRGHGGSKNFKAGGEAIDPEKLGRTGIDLMSLDVEACKKFLMDKNNAGELNIEMLTVVGADTSCIVAVNWALQDWSWPQLINRKQGQDVKALVLLSPVRNDKGATSVKSLQAPLFTGRGTPYTMSMMMIVGEQDRVAMGEAGRIFSTLERSRPKVKDEERVEKQDLFFVRLNTQIQGTKLLDPRLALGLQNTIRDFIQLRIVAKSEDFQWTDRSRR